MRRSLDRGYPDAARKALVGAGFPRVVVQASGGGDLTVRTGQLDAAGEQRGQEAVTAVGGQPASCGTSSSAPPSAPSCAARPWSPSGSPWWSSSATWPSGSAGRSGRPRWWPCVPRRGHPARAVRLAGQATGRGVPGRAADGDRLLGQRLGGGLRPRLGTLANEACLQTVPRTINTRLGALFILATLFVLGGDTLTDFALALLVGTCSSVFVATPLLVAFEQRAGQRSERPPARSGAGGRRRPRGAVR